MKVQMLRGHGKSLADMPVDNYFNQVPVSSAAAGVEAGTREEPSRDRDRSKMGMFD